MLDFFKTVFYGLAPASVIAGVIWVLWLANSVSGFPVMELAVLFGLAILVLYCLGMLFRIYLGKE